MASIARASGGCSVGRAGRSRSASSPRPRASLPGRAAAAGTGKTFALDAARAAWEAQGIRVFGCALSAPAAAELHDQTGIDASTIAQLRIDLGRGYGLPVGGVLIVDEAGMVGSRQLAELADQAAAHRTKLVLVGDDRQLLELEAGGGFAGLADRLAALELSEVRRQRNDWDRDALSALRQGDVAAWSDAYRDQGRIVARPSARQVREALVGDWWQAACRDGLENALMLAHRRADVRDLNERARRLMHADGRLGDQEVDVADRRFAVGKRVVTTHDDRRLQVANGWRGTVRELHSQQHAMTVELDNGRSVVLDAGYLEDGHLDHGYAATAHKAQGATLDSVFVLGSEDLYWEWGYTALTRHRDEAKFYVVSSEPAERGLPALHAEPDQLTPSAPAGRSASPGRRPSRSTPPTRPCSRERRTPASSSSGATCCATSSKRREARRLARARNSSVSRTACGSSARSARACASGTRAPSRSRRPHPRTRASDRALGGALGAAGRRRRHGPLALGGLHRGARAPPRRDPRNGAEPARRRRAPDASRKAGPRPRLRARG